MKCEKLSDVVKTPTRLFNETKSLKHLRLFGYFLGGSKK